MRSPIVFFRRTRTNSTESTVDKSESRKKFFQTTPKVAPQQHLATVASSGSFSVDDHRHNQASSSCMICLETMQATDQAHPIMCKSIQCSFNFCMRCIERLMEQQRASLTSQTTRHEQHKDEYGHPDGEDKPNKSVVCSVYCPNCRSDLGPQVYDTLLLRKIDQVRLVQDDDNEDMSELRKAMNVDVTLLKEIADARDREAKFWKTKEADGELPFGGGHVTPRHEEIGFEIDLKIGPLETIKLPHMGPSTTTKSDLTLLSGLGSAMSKQDKEYLTQQLTSGDTSRLAQAAEVLSVIAESVYSGVSGGSDTEARRLHWSRKSSVYQIIEDGKVARKKCKKRQKKAREASANSGMSRRQGWSTTHTKSSTVKAAQHRVMDHQIRQQLAYRRQYPLPARMPKYAEFSELPLGFCSDTWDGSVADAFTAIYVGTGATNACMMYDPVDDLDINSYVVFRSKMQNEGINVILDTGRCGNVRIDTEHQRVLVASILTAEAGRRGIVKGDVVTHLNGIELRDYNVNELTKLSNTLLKQGEKLRFVFNADQAVAEALKMRAEIIRLAN